MQEFIPNYSVVIRFDHPLSVFIGLDDIPRLLTALPFPLSLLIERGEDGSEPSSFRARLRDPGH